eukprot:1364408-Amphidinium_carterae.1
MSTHVIIFAGTSCQSQRLIFVISASLFLNFGNRGSTPTPPQSQALKEQLLKMVGKNDRKTIDLGGKSRTPCGCGGVGTTPRFQCAGFCDSLRQKFLTFLI